MNNSKNVDVLIIGAGPAGLLLGFYLQTQNIHYVILEKGDGPGNSWKKMPEHLHLITLWKSNCLLLQDQEKFDKFKAHSALEFANYLEEFASQNHLNVLLQFNVEEFKKEQNTFVIKAEKETFYSQILVDCTGYYSYPFTPPYKMSGTRPKMIHFKDFNNASIFNHFEKICVVGKRLSAGQVVKELCEARPDRKLMLSSRSKIIYGSPSWIFNLILKHLDIFEWFLSKFISKKSDLEIPMHREIKSFIESQVRLCSDIKEIVDSEIFFQDGKKESVDLIIFTTGFKKPKPDLKNDFESSETENLFYLGLNSQRTFASRFLRGIREDAPILAKLICGRVASKKSSQ